MAAPDMGNAAQARHLFGEYEILDECGYGATGVVYRAWDESLGREVALKVLRDRLRGHAHIVRRFEREAQAVARLNHPHIVQVYSVGLVDQIPYLAMEYIEGEPLSRLMQRDRRLPWERALEIAAEVADALTAAHHANIIHRDIKPNNILLDEDGKAYVTDFGIAKILDAETQLTVDGAILGTPHYMSPERCKNGDLTASSDMYSLGVVLFQLMAGKLPYKAESTAKLVNVILSEPVPRLRDHVKDVPEDVERLVAYLLEKDPRHRPSCGREVSNAIARIRAGIPLDEDGMTQTTALAKFREGINNEKRSAPTPATSDFTPRTTTHVKKHQARLPRWLWASALVVACGLCGAVAGWMALAPDPTHYAPAPSFSDAPHLALWQAPGDVATFTDETSSVLLARLHLPGFAVKSTVWDGASQQVVARLDGEPSGPRSGERCICAFAPAMRTASLLVPPIPEVFRSGRVLHDTAASVDDEPSLQTIAAKLMDGSELDSREDLTLDRHPSGAFEIACDKDRKGNFQLWAVETVLPHRRVQLTHLDAGTAPTCSISPDGAWALTTLANATEPNAVLVDLATVAF